MKLQRLSGRKVCDRIIRRGHVWKGKTMVIRWIAGHPFHPDVDRTRNALYIGTLASSRLHKSAVKRNRMRRRCREALRVVIKQFDVQESNSSEGAGLAGPAPGGLDVGKGEPVRGKPLGLPLTTAQLLLCPLSASLRAPFPDIQQDVRRFLSTLQSWPNPRSAPASSTSH